MQQALAEPPTPQHERLTPEQIKFFWKRGDYTAHGYLFHLLRALRKDGWWLRIVNVTDFCREWEIDRRVFYRAKAKLIEEGRIQEHLTQIDIRVVANSHTCDTRDAVCHRCDTCDISVPLCRECHTDPPQTLEPSTSCNSTDLIQIQGSDLSQLEREKARAREENFELEETEPSLRIQDVPVPSQASAAIDEDKFSAPSLSKENFEQFRFEGFVPDSHSSYWQWAIAKCKNYQVMRKGSKEPIDNLDAYTLGCIKQRGSGGFKRYLQDIGELPPDPTPDIPASAPTKSRPSQIPEAYRKSQQNLSVIYERNGIEGVIAALNAILAGGNAPSDPDKVHWLIAQNAQWGLVCTNGRIEQLGKRDMSDVSMQIQIRIRELQMGKEELEGLLTERYGVKQRSRLDDDQLVDLAQFLSQWGTG